MVTSYFHNDYVEDRLTSKSPKTTWKRKICVFIYHDNKDSWPTEPPQSYPLPVLKIKGHLLLTDLAQQARAWPARGVRGECQLRSPPFMSSTGHLWAVWKLHSRVWGSGLLHARNLALCIPYTLSPLSPTIALSRCNYCAHFCGKLTCLRSQSVGWAFWPQNPHSYPQWIIASIIMLKQDLIPYFYIIMFC